MQKATDAMVSAADLRMAIEEMRRGYGKATMARLLATELHLAVYIEGIAGHLANQSRTEKPAEVMADAMQRILVIVRQWRSRTTACGVTASHADSPPWTNDW